MSQIVTTTSRVAAVSQEVTTTGRVAELHVSDSHHYSSVLTHAHIWSCN